MKVFVPSYLWFAISSSLSFLLVIQSQEEKTLHAPCLLLYKEIQYDNAPSSTSSDDVASDKTTAGGSWECEITLTDNNNGKTTFISKIEGLDFEWIDEHQHDMISGETLLFAPDGIISENYLTLTIPSSTDPALSTSPHAYDTTPIGERGVLIVRFNALDTQTSIDDDELHDQVFGKVNSRLKSCSFDKLELDPIDDYSDNGVLTIDIPFNILGGVMELDTQIINYGLAKLMDLFESDEESSLKDIASHIMFCLPPGIKEFPVVKDNPKQFVGYGYVNHWLSVYSDGNCDSMPITIHNIGHNLGLANSAEGNNEHGDTSGLMGMPFDEDDLNICFNGVKSWNLGWYEDKHVIVNPLEGTWDEARGDGIMEHYEEPDGWDMIIRDLVGISDYPVAGDKRDLIVKVVGDDEYEFYITYNRQSPIYSDAVASANEVVITAQEIDKRYSTSYVVAQLGKGDSFDLHLNGDTPANLVTISVDEIDTSSEPWFATVRIVGPRNNDGGDGSQDDESEDDDEDDDELIILKDPCLLLYKEIQYTEHNGDGPTPHDDYEVDHGSWECEVSNMNINGKTETFIAKIEGLDEEWAFDNSDGMISGKSFIYAKDALISENKLTLTIPPDVVPTLTLREKDNKYEGDHIVLVVRFDALNAQTSGDEKELHDDIFGSTDDTSNLASQIDACSYGKLSMLPAVDESNDIFAVTTVTIPDVMELDAEIRNYGISKIMEIYEDTFLSLSEVADHIMFCLPPGIKEFPIVENPKNLIGYGYINHYLSVLSNDFCSSMTAQVHMIGHNLGLANSVNGAFAYGDTSGLMGASYSDDDGPNMCFNGAKSWQLGWYEDRHVIINPFEEIWDGQLVGISDYEKSEGREVLLKIEGDVEYEYFVVFNRQAGINSGTQMGANQVVITATELSKESSPSFVVAQLEKGQTFSLTNFGGQDETVSIIVEDIDEDSMLWYATVRVVGDDEPTPVQQPSEKPVPTRPPVTGKQTLTPISSCKDDDDWRYITKVLRSRTCNWVADAPEARCEKLGMDGRTAHKACQKTCGACDA